MECNYNRFNTNNDNNNLKRTNIYTIYIYVNKTVLMSTESSFYGRFYTTFIDNLSKKVDLETKNYREKGIKYSTFSKSNDLTIDKDVSDQSHQSTIIPNPLPTFIPPPPPPPPLLPELQLPPPPPPPLLLDSPNKVKPKHVINEEKKANTTKKPLLSDKSQLLDQIKNGRNTLKKAEVIKESNRKSDSNLTIAEILRRSMESRRKIIEVNNPVKGDDEDDDV